MITSAGVAAAVLTGVLVALLVGGPQLARRRLADRPVASRVVATPGMSVWIRLPAGALAGGVVGWFLWPSGIAVVAAAVVLIGVVVGLGRLRPALAQRTAEQIAVDLPTALELLAGCLGSGMPSRAAVREVCALTGGPLADRLAPVVAGLELGSDDAAAWRSLEADEVLGRLARDVVRSADSGSPLAELLLAHAARARTVRHQLLRSRARSAGVRSVLPVTLCFLPAFLLIGVVPVVAGAVTALLP